MKEDFLHYLWKFQKFQVRELHTVAREKIEIITPGQHNHLSGPDFFDARLRIGGQLWAGNVEIHIRSSHWYAHGHEKDRAYDNVVLHVVWEDDAPVFRGDNTRIPALELKTVTPDNLQQNYRKLLKNSCSFINCEKSMARVDPFLRDAYLERLFFERMERKSVTVLQDLKRSDNDWEAVFFRQLMRNFGLKINGESFRSVADSIDFKVVRKVQHEVLLMEALLFGQAGLLGEDETPDTYMKVLRKEYLYLQRKFGLSSAGVVPPYFHRLRPANFPTVRLSQLANLYCQRKTLFTLVMETDRVADFYSVLESSASPYWDDHYTFGKISGKHRKVVSRNFMDLLIVNTVLPVKFCYMRYLGREADEHLLELARSLNPEKNSITAGYTGIGIKPGDVADSQALLQLYHAYCSENRCVECTIGHQLLKT